MEDQVATVPAVAADTIGHDDVETDAAQAVDEQQNEVLQFLLGKTPTIFQSCDTSSVTSTDTDGSRSLLDLSDHVVTERGVAKVPVKDVPTSPSNAVTELQPVSETDSDDAVDETFRSSSTHTNPQRARGRVAGNVEVGRVHPMQSHAPDPSVRVSLNQGAENEQLDIQPEHEDVSVACSDERPRLRQRRAPPSKSAVLNESPTIQKPAKGQQSPHLATVRAFVSTQSDLLFVALILCVLGTYCLAIVYRAFHPISYPLPNVDALFQPYDVSNVSARFRSPVSGQSFTNAVVIEWEITHFPAGALRQHGPEPFEYRVLLDKQQLVFDVGVWSVESDDVTEINKTISYRLRPREIPTMGVHELRLEVTFAIPGSDDELHTLSAATSFHFSTPPDTSTPRLTITSPADNAVVTDRSVLIEYDAQNVQTLEVVIDREWRMRKKFLSDGNLLLRGLGAGSHSVLLEAFDDDGIKVTSDEIHVVVQQ